MQQSVWFIYMIHYSPNAIYTGITTDMMRRFEQHVSGKGAKCLRGKQNLKIIYCCQVGQRGCALRLEYKIKQLPQTKKWWVSQNLTSLDELQAYLKCSDELV